MNVMIMHTGGILDGPLLHDLPRRRHAKLSDIMQTLQHKVDQFIDGPCWHVFPLQQRHVFCNTGRRNTTSRHGLNCRHASIAEPHWLLRTAGPDMSTQWWPVGGRALTALRWPFPPLSPALQK